MLGVDLHPRTGGAPAPRRQVAGVKVDRADHRLERVGQDRRPLAAAGAGLALAQPQHGRQAQPDRQLEQGVLLDEVGAHADRSPSGKALSFS
jgi:hypothetical protein